MQLRPDIQIQSMVKAMADVVLPAIDKANPLAIEQARLCMGMLGVMAAQLPLQYRYDCDELDRMLALAERVHGLREPATVAPAAAQALAQTARRAAEVRERARAEPSEVLGAVRALRAATSSLVQECSRDDPDGSRSAELHRAVMDASREQLERERAWVAGQGWEAGAKAGPPIESLLTSVNPAPRDSN